MARENPSWGYTRLRGALENLGFDLGRSTIQRILAEHGIEPAPLRGRTMPWRTFLKAHWGAVAAADFFTVEVLTRGGLVRYLVLFVIDLKTRCVHIPGVTSQADAAWMAQVARNLTDAAAGPLRGFGHLLVDRDPLHGTSASGTSFPLANVICAPCCASSWSTTTPSATTRAWTTSSPSPAAIRPRPSDASADAKDSVACSPSTSEAPRESVAIELWDNTRW